MLSRNPFLSVHNCAANGRDNRIISIKSERKAYIPARATSVLNRSSTEKRESV